MVVEIQPFYGLFNSILNSRIEELLFQKQRTAQNCIQITEVAHTLLFPLWSEPEKAAGRF